MSFHFKLVGQEAPEVLRFTSNLTNERNLLLSLHEWQRIPFIICYVLSLALGFLCKYIIFSVLCKTKFRDKPINALVLIDQIGDLAVYGIIGPLQIYSIAKGSSLASILGGEGFCTPYFVLGVFGTASFYIWKVA